MYTIYVNDCPLVLAPSSEPPSHEFQLRYPGSPKFFLQVCGTLEGGKHPSGICVTCPDVERAWSDFKSHFTWVPAAGGAVRRGQALLCIHRLGRWDLPKGKIEDGEETAEAALREVKEETGLHELELGDALATTYHTYYTRKGKRVLKPTYWYTMRTEQAHLVPQTEEAIERAEWIDRKDAAFVLADMYPSLRGVAEAAWAIG